MRKAPKPRALLEAAEKAAGAGDYASAETLLRDAARAQEASLGPLHPDLANTLNNLGVVCEITGKAADAEQYFRRALTIATTALDPEHPFVITSRTNLREFCEARGSPLDVAKPAPEEAVKPPEEVVKPGSEELVKPAPEAKPYDPVAESKRLFTRLALGALGPIAMLMIVLSAGLPRLGALDHATAPPSIPVDSPPAPVPVDAQPEPAPAPAKESVEPVTTPQETVQILERPMLVAARLCATLDDWQCDPADRPVPPGQLFFYTKVASPIDTTVQHRWYLDNRLYYTVDLRILASPAIGFRAFSRNRMSTESKGNWRIEVRTEDGTLLHEERFSVR